MEFKGFTNKSKSLFPEALCSLSYVKKWKKILGFLNTHITFTILNITQECAKFY
jgi:hypothetical protein